MSDGGGAPAPQPVSLTVSVKRTVRLARYESVEIMASLGVETDRRFTAGDNMDRVYGLVSGKVERWASHWMQQAEREDGIAPAESAPTAQQQ